MFHVLDTVVSTHSRPKAAGENSRSKLHNIVSFNTQPPEGGCTQSCKGCGCYCVSTHSRPKAAAAYQYLNLPILCFNTQPPEGGCFLFGFNRLLGYGFNTQPPEGG